MINKLDQIAEDDRAAALERIETRMRERNPHAHVVGAIGARIDPALLYDVAEGDEGSGSCRSANCSSMPTTPHPPDHHDHVHAASVTVTSDGCIDPGALLDLLEEPPPGVYRLKGTVAVRARERVRTVRRQRRRLVGSRRDRAAEARTNCLVAIGTHFDVDDVRARVDAALRPHDGIAATVGMRRLQRYRRLSF